MLLDRNPENFFAEVEQAPFDPSNLVPGTGLSPDRMLMGRIFSYHDTHLHRIGPNYQQVPTNAPKVEVHSYNKDGFIAFRHAGPQPVYAPNSYGGPEADPERAGTVVRTVAAGELGRYAYDKHAADDDFGQAGTLVAQVMNDTDRDHLVTNIVGHASDHVTDEIQLQVIAYWTCVDGRLGARVAEGLGCYVNSGAFKEATRVVERRANRA